MAVTRRDGRRKMRARLHEVDEHADGDGRCPTLRQLIDARLQDVLHCLPRRLVHGRRPTAADRDLLGGRKLRSGCHPLLRRCRPGCGLASHRRLPSCNLRVQRTGRRPVRPPAGERLDFGSRASPGCVAGLDDRCRCQRAQQCGLPADAQHGCGHAAWPALMSLTTIASQRAESVATKQTASVHVFRRVDAGCCRNGAVI